MLPNNHSFLLIADCLLTGQVGCAEDNKPLTLYEHPDASYVSCMAARRDGNAVLSGHADSSLHSMMTQDLQAPPSLLSTPAHPLPLLGVLTHCWSLAVIARSAGFNLCSLMGCQCARTLCRAALLML